MKSKRSDRQLELEGVRSEFLFDAELPTEKERLEAQAKFIVERHRVYLKRASGLPKPWTTDPVLRTSRFTNVYREIDKVTVWIWDNVIRPNLNNPNLPVLVGLARTINKPETIQMLIDEGVWPEQKLASRKFYKTLTRYQMDGNTIVTGAYIVNSQFPKDYEGELRLKSAYIADITAAVLWDNKELLAESGRKGTMAGFMAAIGSLHGFGPFLSYQVAVDLSYSKNWLGSAEDVNTFTSPGPGTTKGMNWIISGSLHGKVRGPGLNPHMNRVLPKVNRLVRKMVSKKEWNGDPFTGFAEISMSNYSNCCCETSKMVRSILDGGTHRMKNKYAGS